MSTRPPPPPTVVITRRRGRRFNRRTAAVTEVKRFVHGPSAAFPCPFQVSSRDPLRRLEQTRKHIISRTNAAAAAALSGRLPEPWSRLDHCDGGRPGTSNRYFTLHTNTNVQLQMFTVCFDRNPSTPVRYCHKAQQYQCLDTRRFHRQQIVIKYNTMMKYIILLHYIITIIC